MGRRAWLGWTGPTRRAPAPTEDRVSAALPDAGQQRWALGARARGPGDSGRPCLDARTAHRAVSVAAAGAEAGVRGGGSAGDSGRSLAAVWSSVRLSVRTGSVAHTGSSLQVSRSAQLPLDRPPLHPPPPRAGFFFFLKGRLTRMCSGCRPQGLPKLPWPGYPRHNLWLETPLLRAHLREALRGGVCAS